MSRKVEGDLNSGLQHFECAAELVGKYESESEDASGRYACGVV